MEISESNLGLRESGCELLGIKPHVLQADRIDDSNPNGSTYGRLLLCYLRLGFFEILQQRLAGVKEPTAFRRHHKRTLCPIDQLRTEFFFKLADRLAGGGL